MVPKTASNRTTWNQRPPIIAELRPSCPLPPRRCLAISGGETSHPWVWNGVWPHWTHPSDLPAPLPVHTRITRHRTTEQPKPLRQVLGNFSACRATASPTKGLFKITLPKVPKPTTSTRGEGKNGEGGWGEEGEKRRGEGGVETERQGGPEGEEEGGAFSSAAIGPNTRSSSAAGFKGNAIVKSSSAQPRSSPAGQQPQQLCRNPSCSGCERLNEDSAGVVRPGSLHL